MAKKKQHKTIKPLGKKELMFNITSLLAVIAVGIYFGSRSFYYYSKQNMRIKEEAQTLNGVITTINKVTKEGDGLHQDTSGYYFKGNVTNNYVKFANRLFRIIRINNDKTVKLVSEDLVATFMWGENSSYKNSNLEEFLVNKTNQYGTSYFDTIPNPSKFLVKTAYSEDTLQNSKVSSTKKTSKSYITTLGIKDYSNANGKNSYLNISKAFWLLGFDKDKSNLYIDTDGSIQSTETYESYGLRAVMTLKKNLPISQGDGSKENPFVINQGSDINYVDSYVRLGQDIWKVSYDDSNVLKLYLNNNIANVLLPYSSTNSLFDFTDDENIAYILNTTYLASLPYNSLINDTYFFTGEVSSETSFKLSGIYANYTAAKIGLLNIFDYYTGPSDNFFYLTTTSSVGSMGYVHHNTGLLEESRVNELKSIVPVISINKNLIKSGLGTLDNPYVVE